MSYGVKVHPFDAFMLRCLGVVGTLCIVLGVKFITIQEYLASGLMFFFAFLLFRDVYVFVRNVRALAELDKLIEGCRDTIALGHSLYDEFRGEKKFDRWTL